MNEAEQDLFYRANADRLYRFCYRLSGDDSLAEDIAATSFYRFFRQKDALREPAAAQTYLFRIAVREWSNLRRRDLLFRKWAPTASQDIDVDLRLDLDKAIDSLAPKLKLALVLVKAEGLTYAEASQVLQVPVGTVQTRVRQATLSLKRMLDPDSHCLTTQEV